MAPFAGLHVDILRQWDMDFGFRYDFYHTDNIRHGSLLAFSPRHALADSVNGNLCYRFRTTFEMPGHSRLSLISGTSSQVPTRYELDYNPELLTIQTARHTVEYAGTLTCGTGYRFCGYYNQLWNIPQFSGAVESNALQSIGQQRSRGAMLQLDQTFAKRVTAKLGYSISSCDMRSADTADWQRAFTDRRHKFNVLLMGHLPFGVECGINCMATSGTSYTPLTGIIESESGSSEYLPVYGSLNSATGDPYCNLSATISYLRQFGKCTMKAFVEGVNLLQPSEIPAVAADQIFFSIDTRSIVFGVNIGF
jgi:hypothetical protein